MVNTAPVSISYGYQSSQVKPAEVNYDNEFQLRPQQETTVVMQPLTGLPVEGGNFESGPVTQPDAGSGDVTATTTATG